MKLQTWSEEMLFGFDKNKIKIDEYFHCANLYLLFNFFKEKRFRLGFKMTNSGVYESLLQNSHMN